MKKALQALKNRKSMNPERVAAAQQEDMEEQEERRTLAIESLVCNTGRMAASLETLVRHYKTVVSRKDTAARSPLTCNSTKKISTMLRIEIRIRLRLMTR